LKEPPDAIAAGRPGQDSGGDQRPVGGKAAAELGWRETVL
jgi:hypothetical protein